MYNLALSYLKRGWSVLPCGKNKVPLISWKEFQTRFPTETEVKGWFERFPDGQVGIITGKISNLTVVDFEKGADPSEFPQETLIVQTGGLGYHYFYLYEEGVTNKARIKELVDIRSEGGFVVAGGSVSEKGPYTILQDKPLLPFPKQLFPEKVDAFSFPEKEVSFQTGDSSVNPYGGAWQGTRNDDMTRYIGHVLTRIHPSDWDSEAWNIIVSANSRNTPPLAPRELKATFESIKRAEKSNSPLRHLRRSNWGGLVPSTVPKQEGPQILTEETDEIKHIADVADEQRIDQNDIYPLQMKCFDEAILGGVSPGDVVVIAGQTGEGKTTLAQDWTMSMVRGVKKAKALWFSYEVLPSHLWSKFQEMGMTREDCAFIPAKHTSGNVAWVEQKIREGKEKFGIKTVFIDHLGFLLPKTDGILGKNLSSNYASFLTQVMRDLKTMAIREEIILFLPVHMKKPDYRSKRADINDIKDSSGVGQESDLVFLIEREKDTDKDSTSYFTDVTKITLAKNRKTGMTVIGRFSMLNGRFAYDDSKEKADEEFKNFGKKAEPVKEEVKKEVVPPQVFAPPQSPPQVPYAEDNSNDEAIPDDNMPF